MQSLLCSLMDTNGLVQAFDCRRAMICMGTGDTFICPCLYRSVLGSMPCQRVPAVRSIKVSKLSSNMHHREKKKKEKKKRKKRKKKILETLTAPGRCSACFSWKSSERMPDGVVWFEATLSELPVYTVSCWLVKGWTWQMCTF